MEIILLICGCYSILIGLVVNTKNFISSILFKVVPFLSGVMVCLVAMDLLGWISIW